MKAMRMPAVWLAVCALATSTQADEFSSRTSPLTAIYKTPRAKGTTRPASALAQAGRPALQLNWEQVQVPDSRDLRLARRLTIDGWCTSTTGPTGYQPLVIKGNEYQLRLDDQREGGRFSFFVYLDGWEPRVSTTVPGGRQVVPTSRRSGQGRRSAWR